MFLDIESIVKDEKMDRNRIREGYLISPDH